MNIRSRFGSTPSVALTSERREEFELLQNRLISDYNPVGIVEAELVTEMAVSLWRLRRIRAFDPARMDSDTLGDQRLLRYRSSIGEQLHRAIVLLGKLQKDRSKPPRRPPAKGKEVIEFPRANVLG
jgi:hypothetical protein